MIVTANQRWRDGRDSYRPLGEVIATGAYEVAEIESDTAARAFVEAHHYSGTFPAARRRFGLYRTGGALVGVAVFSHPTNDRVLTSCLPGAATDSVELGRFVLLDDVPSNGESWFLARCFDVLRRDFTGVVSFSDPLPRQTAAGRTVFGGHVGTIYQASNAVYLGLGTPRALRLLPDGRSLNARTLQKIRKRERGWRAAVELLVSYGAQPLGACEPPAAWLAAQLPRLVRRVRHAGNHKYVWAFDRTARRKLPASLPYPKLGWQPAMEATP